MSLPQLRALCFGSGSLLSSHTMLCLCPRRSPAVDKRMERGGTCRETTTLARPCGHSLLSIARHMTRGGRGTAHSAASHFRGTRRGTAPQQRTALTMRGHRVEGQDRPRRAWRMLRLSAARPWLPRSVDRGSRLHWLWQCAGNPVDSLAALLDLGVGPSHPAVGGAHEDGRMLRKLGPRWAHEDRHMLGGT